MIEVNASVEISNKFKTRLEKAKQIALERTAYALLDDLRDSGTMPFETGHLQNDSTFVEIKRLVATIVSATPYARRLYFNPDFNFRQDKNPNAGGLWFDPYLEGHIKGDYVRETFAHFLKEAL